jgi:hypothetical protein
MKLEGRWLEDLGFKEGQVVEVEEEEEKITIRVRRRDENSHFYS